MMTRLVTLDSCSERARLIEQAERIFFETAPPRTFDSAAEEHAFLKRWFGNYAEAHPSAFLIALDEKGEAAGYLAGCPDSFSPASAAIIGDIDYFTPAFCAALINYPSHFHINVKPGLQGKGLGHLLVSRFAGICANEGAAGIHVVTGASSRAVAFYEGVGFRRVTPYARCDPGLAVLVRPIAAHSRG